MPGIRTPPLKAALLEAQGRRTADWVIEYAGYPIDAIRTAFEETTRRAGFAKGEVTPYTLRHTAATWMAQAGVSLWTIANILGHSTTRMVEKHYAHFHTDFQRPAIDALEARMAAAADAPQAPPSPGSASAGRACAGAGGTPMMDGRIAASEGARS